jgi:hypothetical protein
MAPDLCLEEVVGETSEKFSDRKIWQMFPFAINLSVTKSFGLMLSPLLSVMTDPARNHCKPPAEFRRNY